ncbi:hypothetical protein U1Q18_003422 [Sarracenia purpurea var. burkii]
MVLSTLPRLQGSEHLSSGVYSYRVLVLEIVSGQSVVDFSVELGELGIPTSNELLQSSIECGSINDMRREGNWELSNWERYVKGEGTG